MNAPWMPQSTGAIPRTKGQLASMTNTVLEQPTALMLASDEDNKTTQYLMEFQSSPFYC